MDYESSTIDSMSKFIRYNENTKKDLEKVCGKELSRIPSDYYNRFTFRCITCGQYVNAMIIKFFSYDVSLIMCYDCQKKDREISEKTYEKTYEKLSRI